MDAHIQISRMGIACVDDVGQVLTLSAAGVVGAVINGVPQRLQLGDDLRGDGSVLGHLIQIPGRTGDNVVVAAMYVDNHILSSS